VTTYLPDRVGSGTGANPGLLTTHSTSEHASGASPAAAQGWFSQEERAPDGDQRSLPTYLDAIHAALEDELAEDERVVLLGEDIGAMGGAFRVTEGLQARFGDERVIDTPMAEIAIVGAGIGLAVNGMRPIVELQFADFVSCAYDMLVTEAAKLHYRFGIPVPLVVRAPSGGGVGAGPFHSQNPEGVFAHVPGLKVVCPGDVQDAYDLLRAAVRDPNPVLYFEHKGLYRSARGPLVRRPPALRLDESAAAVRRAGADVTVVTYGGMLRPALAAAEQLELEGIDTEVVDLRVVFPADHDLIGRSVEKTSRLVIVHEDTLSSGVGAEIAARVVADRFYALDAPIRRVAAPDTPVPFAAPLESAYVPSTATIAEAVREVVSL
jgi:2-oxoisovalerate dehydrogenase E1 component beta subunit